MAATDNCPSCNKRLRAVTPAHVMRHVRGDRRGDVKDIDYGFCATPGCPVAFVARDGSKLKVDSLRWPPGYKTTDLTDLLCYCFDIAAGSAVGPDAPDIERFIGERVRANDCACDILNPSTQCCLGSIATFKRDHAAAYRH